MTDRIHAPRTVRGLMVLGSSLALVLGAVGATVAHPASAVHVASTIDGGNLRHIITARILLIEPGITDDDLDEVVDQLVDEAENGDAETPEVETPEVETPEVETPEVDVPEVKTPKVEQPDANEVDEQEADDDQGEDNDDQGEHAEDQGHGSDGDQSESDDGGEGDGGD